MPILDNSKEINMPILMISQVSNACQKIRKSKKNPIDYDSFSRIN
jgi:hypothetical protein